MWTWRGADGKPDPNTSYAAMLMQMALYQDDVATARQVAAYLGGTLVAWTINRGTLPPDFAVVRTPDGAYVALEGTCNLDQVQSYVAGGAVPAKANGIPSTGTIAISTNSGFQRGLAGAYADIVTVLGGTAGRHLRVSGYSYGMGCAQILARQWKALSPAPASVEVIGFGGPKSFSAQAAAYEPDYWARIQAYNPPVSGAVAYDDPGEFDPVTLLPPRGGLASLISAPLYWLAQATDYFWQHFGESFGIQDDGTMGTGFSADYSALFAQREVGIIVAQFQHLLQLHLPQNSYLPRMYEYWRNSATRDNALSSFNTFTQLAATYSIPSLQPLGPALQPADVNAGYFISTTAPVDSANLAEVAIVSPNPYFASAYSSEGGSAMTMFKGTFLFNSGDGPFSESVYSTVTTETQQTMTAKMRQLSQYRMKLSVGPDVADCPNPVIPYGIRVEDELIVRDSKLTLAVQQGSPAVGEFYNPGSSWTERAPLLPQYGELSNLNMDLCTRVKIASGLPQQVAYSALHGIPLTAVVSVAADGAANFSAAFLRVANFSGAYQTALYNYLAAMGSMGLGYRSIAGAWNTAQNTPGGYSNPDIWAYDTANQQVQLWWLQTTRAGVAAPLNTNAWPAGRADAPPNWPNANAICRLQVRRWKGFNVLQGRWAARVLAPATISGVAYAWGLQILRQVRLPQIAATNVPQVSPIAWNVWVPGNVALTNPMTGANPSFNASNLPVAAVRDTCSIQYVEEHKVGKVPYGAEPGRVRNRPT